MTAITVWGGSTNENNSVQHQPPWSGGLNPGNVVPGDPLNPPFGGDGGLGDPVDYTLGQPTITFPNASDNENISDNDTATSSAFSVLGGDMARTHVASRWWIMYVGPTEDGTNAQSEPTVMFDSQADTVNLTSLPFADMEFEHESYYKIMVRYKASDGNWGPFSEYQQFSTRPCNLMFWDPAISNPDDLSFNADNTIATLSSAAAGDYNGAFAAVGKDPADGGKWYVELEAGGTVSGVFQNIGVAPSTAAVQWPNAGPIAQDDALIFRPNGQVFMDGSLVINSGVTYTAGDNIGVALDLSAVPNTIRFYKNGAFVLGPYNLNVVAAPWHLVNFLNGSAGTNSLILSGNDIVGPLPAGYEKWV